MTTKTTLVAFSLCFMLLFAQSESSGISEALINKLKSIVGTFSQILFNFLSQFEFFNQVFDTNLTPEEATRMGQMAAELFYKEVEVPLDEEVAKMSRDGFKRAFAKHITPAGFAMSFGVLLEDYLMRNNITSGDAMPTHVLNFATMLNDNVNERGTTYQLQVEHPYFGALMKTLAQFTRSLKKLDEHDVKKLAVKFFEEMDKKVKNSE